MKKRTAFFRDNNDNNMVIRTLYDPHGEQKCLNSGIVLVQKIRRFPSAVHTHLAQTRFHDLTRYKFRCNHLPRSELEGLIFINYCRRRPYGLLYKTLG
jgi:hypothetical protein